MCTSRNAIASSETLRWRESTTNRGQRGCSSAHVEHAEHDRGGQQQQRDRARGAGQIPVQARSRCRQRGQPHDGISAASGQSPTVTTSPSVGRRGVRAGPCLRSHAVRRRPARAPRSRRCSRRCSVAAATLTVRQVSRTGAPVRGSMMWCIVVAGVAPASYGRARGRQSARADRDRLAGRVGGRAVVVGDVDRPAAGGAPSGCGDVAADARPARRIRRPAARRCAARSAAHALAVAPRSTRHRRAPLTAQRRAVEIDSRASRRPTCAAVMSGRAWRLTQRRARRAGASHGRTRPARARGRSSGRRRRPSVAAARSASSSASPAAGSCASSVRRCAFASESSESARKRLHAWSIAASSCSTAARAAGSAAGSLVRRITPVPRASQARGTRWAAVSEAVGAAWSGASRDDRFGGFQGPVPARVPVRCVQVCGWLRVAQPVRCADVDSALGVDAAPGVASAPEEDSTLGEDSREDLASDEEGSAEASGACAGGFTAPVVVFAGLAEWWCACAAEARARACADALADFPGKALAATSVSAPVNTMLPAISQRLRRRSWRIDASRVCVVCVAIAQCVDGAGASR